MNLNINVITSVEYMEQFGYQFKMDDEKHQFYIYEEENGEVTNRCITIDPKDYSVLLFNNYEPDFTLTYFELVGVAKKIAEIQALSNLQKALGEMHE